MSRRIVRMNKRLECETGERLFEKRGWKWALTSFALEIWGEENGTQESDTLERSMKVKVKIEKKGDIMFSSVCLECSESALMMLDVSPSALTSVW